MKIIENINLISKSLQFLFYLKNVLNLFKNNFNQL